MARIRSEYGVKDSERVVDDPGRYRPTIYNKFADVEEVIAFASRDASPWLSRASRSEDPQSRTRTWEEAVGLARYGWNEGRAKLIKELRIYALTTGVASKDWAYDYAGAFPDVPRFLGGQPDCMVDLRPEQRAFRPIVRIAVSPITFGDVPFDAIVAWGAALVSWIDELEDAGKRVEITWLSCSLPCHITDEDEKAGTCGPRFAVRFCLKEADQPVELDRLAFWIMHPAAQRRMQFAIKEQFPIQRSYSTYGRPVFDVKFLQTFCEPNTMVFSVGEGASSVKQGVDELRKKAGFMANDNTTA